MFHELPSPSKISLLLDMPHAFVNEIIYFVSYIIVDNNGRDDLFLNKEVINLTSNKTSKNNRTKIRNALEEIKTITKKANNTIDFNRANEYYDRLKDSALPFSIIEVFSFIKKYLGIEIGYGAEAIQKLLAKINLTEEKNNIEKEIKILKPNDPKFKKTTKRLETIT
ncbi:hypothetical protein FACS189459_3620 [Bacilli bacterium]|nr:hypothetical protein FACS189459_3620 [Bacilli bacterium]